MPLLSFFNLPRSIYSVALILWRPEEEDAKGVFCIGLCFISYPSAHNFQESTFNFNDNKLLEPTEAILEKVVAALGKEENAGFMIQFMSTSQF
ncbi:hypothetical protein RIF29_15249 [Crotalaria pallida]|uniref:Uncharacterized protein n=1 Tax=Crotalaria pallida TaxID=3830 RepID=A0AAN9FGY1_CROPI